MLENQAEDFTVLIVLLEFQYDFTDFVLHGLLRNNVSVDVISEALEKQFRPAFGIGREPVA